MSEAGSTQRDVIIVGGGISGTAAAWNLALRKFRVTLVERGDIASMASGWTLAGVRQSGRHPSELPLAKAAVQIWEHLGEALEADTEYRQEGNLRLALTEDEVPAIQQVVDESNAVGIEAHFLTPEQVHELAPAVSTEIYGASYCPSDGHANPGNTVVAFAKAAERLGAEIRTGVHVESLILEGNRIIGVQTSDGPLYADRVIVATGIYTPKLIGPLGLELPLHIQIVTAVQSVPLPPMLKQVLGCASGGVAGRQQVNGQFRFTGSGEPWGESGWHDWTTTRPQFGSIAEAIRRTIRVVPAFAEARINDVWGGLIDQTPDALPVLQQVPGYEGLIVGAGFSGHGFCLGPITGEILADLAVEGGTTLPIDTFAIERFAARADADESLALHG